MTLTLDDGCTMQSSVKTLKEVEAQFDDAVTQGKGTAKATAKVTGWDAQVLTFDFSVPPVNDVTQTPFISSILVVLCARPLFFLLFSFFTSFLIMTSYRAPVSLIRLSPLFVWMHIYAEHNCYTADNAAHRSHAEERSCRLSDPFTSYATWRRYLANHKINPHEDRISWTSRRTEEGNLPRAIVFWLWSRRMGRAGKVSPG